MDDELLDYEAAARACKECHACQTQNPNLLHAVACHCYDVKCARCGKHGTCCAMHVEEGDEWECSPCNERCNDQERAAVSEREGQ